MHTTFSLENLNRKPRRTWRNNIRMDLREMGGGGVDWMHLAQDKDQWRVVLNIVMNLRVA
jgi:hypothetical protein